MRALMLQTSQRSVSKGSYILFPCSVTTLLLSTEQEGSLPLPDSCHGCPRRDPGNRSSSPGGQRSTNSHTAAVHKNIFHISDQPSEVGGEPVFFGWMNVRNAEKTEVYPEFTSYMTERLHKYTCKCLSKDANQFQNVFQTIYKQ